MLATDLCIRWPYCTYHPDLQMNQRRNEKHDSPDGHTGGNQHSINEQRSNSPAGLDREMANDDSVMSNDEGKGNERDAKTHRGVNGERQDQPDEKHLMFERPLTVGASMLWFVLATSLTIVLLSLTRLIRPGSGTDLVNAVACQAAAYMATVLLMLRVHRVKRGLLQVFALRKSHRGLYLIAALVGPFLQVPADLLQQLMLRILPVSTDLLANNEMLRMDSALMRVMIPLVTAFVGPLVEELFYRGALFGGLRRSNVAVVSVLTVTMVFAMAHGSLHLIVPLFVVGLVLTVFRAASGSLWPCLIAHASFNGVAVVATAVGIADASGQSKGMPWYVSVVGVAGAVALTAAFLLVCKHSCAARWAREEDLI